MKKEKKKNCEKESFVDGRRTLSKMKNNKKLLGWHTLNFDVDGKVVHV